MSALLQIFNLEKRFGGLTALDGLSFAVQPGQILGLIGPNGSGKTTTINVITGIYGASAGQVTFAGADMTDSKPHRVMHAGNALCWTTYGPGSM